MTNAPSPSRGDNAPDRRVGPAAGKPQYDGAFGTTVPRFFLVAIDLLNLTLAFLLAYLFSPLVKTLFLGASWFGAWASILAADAAGQLPPVQEMAWVLLVMAVVVILALQALSAYRPMLLQARTQIVLSSVIAPVSGLAAIALILFALRSPVWSRLFIFLFTGLAVVLLTGYRLGLRWYQVRRIQSGFYARQVVLVGSVRGVERVAQYLERTTTPAQYQVLGYLEVRPVPGAQLAPMSVPRLGTVEGLGELLVHSPIHEVIAIQGTEGDQWLRDIDRDLRLLPGHAADRARGAAVRQPQGSAVRLPRRSAAAAGDRAAAAAISTRTRCSSSA